MQKEYSNDGLPSSWIQYNQTVCHRYILFVLMVCSFFFRLQSGLSISLALADSIRVETEWAHIFYNFTLLPHSFTLVSHRMYKKRCKSQYLGQSAASKLPFNGSHVTLISHAGTDCEFHFTAAIKFLPQSSHHATTLSECGGGMGVVTSDTGRVCQVSNCLL